MISTVTALWAAHPQYRRGVKQVALDAKGRKLYVEKRQNDYAPDVRIAWCDFVENMRRSGDINAMLAKMATL